MKRIFTSVYSIALRIKLKWKFLEFLAKISKKSVQIYIQVYPPSTGRLTPVT